MPQWPARPQTQTDLACNAAPAAAPRLNAGIRRHLGSSLRSFYAALPAEPVDPRIEALLTRLDKPQA